eukprot:3461334-Rhodomonas_salina.1
MSVPRTARYAVAVLDIAQHARRLIARYAMPVRGISTPVPDIAGTETLPLEEQHRPCQYRTPRSDCERQHAPSQNRARIA